MAISIRVVDLDNKHLFTYEGPWAPSVNDEINRDGVKYTVKRRSWNTSVNEMILQVTRKQILHG